MDIPAIALRGITRRFGHFTALRNVTLDIPEGQTLVLFGPNGAGKTTLVHIVAALCKPCSGSVLVHGIDAREEPERVRSRIGLVSHQSLLYDDLTARENLVFYGRMYALDNIPLRTRAALETVGLLARADDRVRGLSRGLCQRLSIARAILHRPPIVLLDEPFTGLDSAARIMLAELLQSLRTQGRTILMTTHDLDQGLAMADRIGILSRGRLVCHLPAAGMTGEALRGLYERSVTE